MKKIILKIEGMSCAACSSSLEKYLNKQENIINATVNLVLSQALIEYNDTLTIENLNKFVEEAGFKSLGIYNEKDISKENNKEKQKIIIYSILSIIIMYISMSHMINLPTIKLLDINTNPINYTIILFILTIPFLIYGKDIFKKGLKSLIYKSPNMDTLVSIGVLSSFIYSIVQMVFILLGNTSYVHNLYFESSSIVIFFIKLGRFIDNKSKEKTKDAIKELVQMTPNKAILKKDNEEKEVSIDEIKKDDILICKPGMKIATDGIIIKGATHLDEAFITGESIPVKKTINDKVIAGSINYDGYIEYKAKNIGKDSTISEIVRLVMNAINTKAPLSRTADIVSSYFVPTVIIISIITFITYLLLGFNLKEALISFVTVLVVACPCALGLATPLAIVISIGQCAKNKILIKTSATLENIYKIDTIVFDKTGTLTNGNLNIYKVFNYSNYKNTTLLTKITSIEKNSTHPISIPFIKYAKQHNLKLLETTNFTNLEGVGITAIIDNKTIYIGSNKILKKLNIENNHIKDELELTNNACSIVYIIEDNKLIGLIGLKDTVKEDAKITLSKLKELNKEVIMLTGDNENTANIIGKQLGIDKIISNVMPKDKTNIIKKLINQNKNVMMIGDGINDAPSLASANIGVSFSNATDIATNSADIILTNNNLYNIINLINISKKTVKNIKQNLFWAFFYNICMIPIAIGLLKPLNIYMNPLIASLSMTLSSITVILNALRLKKIKLK